MPLHSSAPPRLCTFLLLVSSGTLLMIKACSLKPLKPLLLIYSILVPKRPSISPFFNPTQFSWRSFHQGQLTSLPVLSLNRAEGSPQSVHICICKHHPLLQMFIFESQRMKCAIKMILISMHCFHDKLNYISINSLHVSHRCAHLSSLCEAHLKQSEYITNVSN